MPATYEQLMGVQRKNLCVQYDKHDVMLYALSVGMGANAFNEAVLPFVYEGRTLKVLPSMATTLMQIPVVDSGLSLAQLLHGEQRLAMHRPLPSSGTLLVDSGISKVVDRGPGKGLLVVFEAHARSMQDGAPVFTASSTMLARADSVATGSNQMPTPLPAVPDRCPDLTLQFSTTLDQALLYRLNDDMNPLHADPVVAAKMGFPQPILHGLCTYGIACQTIIQAVCLGDHTRMKSLDARFTSPVFPGDELEFEIWLNGPHLNFRCNVEARGVTVLDNGHSLLGLG